jgi:hypothetical protein
MRKTMIRIVMALAALAAWPVAAFICVVLGIVLMLA